MHYTRSLALILLVLSACNSVEEIQLESRQLEGEELVTCQEGPCPKISVEYLYPQIPEHGDSNLARAIDQWVVSAMLIREHQGGEPAFIPDAAERFALDYRNDKEEFPDMSGVYELTVDVSQTYDVNGLWCLKMENYKYTGGAHGNGSTSYLLFDTELDEAVDFDQLIEDQAGFMALAEKTFRSQQGIEYGVPINETGYWFENDQFQLARSIGLENDRVVMVYNPYEIASYADGAIVVEIPLTSATSFLALKNKDQ
jgi:hypothetical protein